MSDGLNVAFAISPGDFEDIVDLLIPGTGCAAAVQASLPEGNLREKLFGKGRARLAAPHPARNIAMHHGEGGGVRMGTTKRSSV